MKGSKYSSTCYRTRSIYVFISLLLSIIFSVTQVYADTSGLGIGGGTNYFALKGGIYTPGSNDLKGFGTGFNGEIALGHYFNNFFATELGVGYYQSSYSQSGAGTIGDASFNTNANLDLAAIPLTLSIKGIYPVQQFEPYVMGGVGVYFASAKLTYNGSFTSGGSTGTISGTANETATAFGGFLGCGANFNINRDWYIGAEGKYLWTRPSFSFGGTDVKINMDGWIVTGNVGYRF